MWWLSLNLLPAFNIVLGMTALPHYTIVLRFLFEFVVVGAVPGTTIKLDFIDSMLIWLVFLSASLLYISFKPSQNQSSELSYQ